MEDKALYSEILGLKPPWEIVDIKLDMKQERIDIYVEWPYVTEAPCPVCRESNQETYCKIHDRRRERVWRHLDTCQMKTYIHCHIPRITCPCHGVKTIQIEWADEKVRFTHLLERLAIQMLQMSANRSQTAKILRISWDEINRIMLRAVDRGLSRRQDEVISSIGMDEKNFLAGHSYVTVMTDNQGKRVIDVAENRDENAVDKIRKKEHRELCRQKNTSLSNTKYLWLKNPNNWTEKDRDRYAVLAENQLAVGRAWNRKELFREFWSLETINEAEVFFKHWYFSATHSRLKPVIEIAKMLNRHLEGLLAWIKHHVSN